MSYSSFIYYEDREYLRFFKFIVGFMTVTIFKVLRPKYRTKDQTLNLQGYYMTYYTSDEVNSVLDVRLK